MGKMMELPLRINELIQYDLDDNIRTIFIMIVSLSLAVMIGLYLIDRWIK